MHGELGGQEDIPSRLEEGEEARRFCPLRWRVGRRQLALLVDMDSTTATHTLNVESCPELASSLLSLPLVEPLGPVELLVWTEGE